MINRYRINERQYIELSSGVTKVFGSHVQRFGQSESGGILLGSVYPGSYVLVEKATTPKYPDQAGPCFFDRSRARAQRIVEREWRDSSGVRIYLGEWHTHSEMHPKPSGRDRRMIRNMFRQTEMHIDFLILVIVGITSVWVGIESGNSLRRLQPMEEGTHINSSQLRTVE
jgi:integrative and conjugative element protein (TIGR02256 family)